ncbi:MAG: hypothetical protein U5K29_15985 [Acidimicrobiales bacterium]|nr:hypothetical protein [Acidimicrobiales bacterium]
MFDTLDIEARLEELVGSLLVGSQLPNAGGLDGAVRGGEMSRDQAAEIAHVLRERPDLDAEAELMAAVCLAPHSRRSTRRPGTRLLPGRGVRRRPT